MGYSPLGGFDFMFNLANIIVPIGFILVFVIIIGSLIKVGIQWNKNNNSPILDVEARVVAKRMAVSSPAHHTGDDLTTRHSYASTMYFATFEVNSGDRIELSLPDREYGMIAEGDIGKLTFQGTRYKGFKRTMVV